MYLSHLARESEIPVDVTRRKKLQKHLKYHPKNGRTGIWGGCCSNSVSSLPTTGVIRGQSICSECCKLLLLCSCFTPQSWYQEGRTMRNESINPVGSCSSTTSARGTWSLLLYQSGSSKEHSGHLNRYNLIGL